MILLALAAQASAVEAERAFARMAQTHGQWTAFRAFAVPKATMFTPDAVNAQAWLKDRKDPPHAMDWWPTASYVSCDGSLTANHGGWRAADGSTGYFTTIWQRQPGGAWKWLADSGDTTSSPPPKVQTIRTVRAPCSSRPSAEQEKAEHGGKAADGTLVWEWSVNTAGDLRLFNVYLWNGEGFDGVIEDEVTIR